MPWFNNGWRKSKQFKRKLDCKILHDSLNFGRRGDVVGKLNKLGGMGAPVCSVTRLGNLLTFGRLFKGFWGQMFAQKHRIFGDIFGQFLKMGKNLSFWTENYPYEFDQWSFLQMSFKCDL